MNDHYPQDVATKLANYRRLRLAVVFSILAVLIWLLLDSIEKETKRAEQQGARLMLNQIRSMLVVKGAEIRLDGRKSFEAQVGANPFPWFKSAPPRYTGVCPEGFPKPGRWCFQPLQTDNNGYKKPEQGESGRVIFRPTQPITLEERYGSRETVLSWTVGVEFRDRNGNGRMDREEPQSGLKLIPTAVRQ